MKKETIVNTIMITLVIFVAVGTGLLVYKHLHDKEQAEQRAALAAIELEKKQTVATSFERLSTFSDLNLRATEGFIFYNKKMLRTKGEYILIMNNNVVLPNGTKVMMDGRVIDPDEKDFNLQEGQMINYNGEVTKTTRTLSGVTPLAVPQYSGKIIGGVLSQYLYFNKEDYDKAVKIGVVIYLQFYSNTSSQSKKQEPEIVDAFESLNTAQIVGFRVHYKDTDATPTEVALAKEFAVKKTGTTILLKDGKKLYSSDMLLNRTDLLNELKKYL